MRKTSILLLSYSTASVALNDFLFEYITFSSMLGSKLKTRQMKLFSALSLQENADDCGGASFISLSTSVFFMCLLFAAVVS